MGKGDGRSKRGKISKGSYGKTRLRSDNKKNAYKPESTEETKS